MFMLSLGVILLGIKHINKIPRKSRVIPVKILFMCFLSSVIIFAPNRGSEIGALCEEKR